MTLMVDGGPEVPIESLFAGDPWARADGDELLITGADRNTDGAFLTLVWTNWCTPGSVNASLRAELTNGDVVNFPVEGSKSPPCMDPASPSRATTEGFFGDPVATPAIGDLAWCMAAEIGVEQGYYVAIPEEPFTDDPAVRRVADMWLWKDAPPPCLIGEWEELRVLDGRGDDISLKVETFERSRLPGQPDSSLVRGPGSVYVKFHWDNWCAEDIVAPLTLQFVLPDDRGDIIWTVDGATKSDGTVDAPACVDDSHNSTLSIAKQF